MTYAPYVRIFLRYAIGALFTAELGDVLANDPDIVDGLSLAIAGIAGVATEYWYRKAKKSGEET